MAINFTLLCLFVSILLVNPVSSLCDGGDNCCDHQECGVGEGDCDSDTSCVGLLKCGSDNCVGESFDATDDCCYDPNIIATRCTGGDSCCSESEPCKEGEGDCDSNLDCENHLLCGSNNCDQKNPGFDRTDDCCYDPTPTTPAIATGSDVTGTLHPNSTTTASPRCDGGDSCCSLSNLCNEGEGDCDSHSDCEGDLLCGSNNCNQQNPGYDPTDDCCYDPTTIAGTIVVDRTIDAAAGPLARILGEGEGDCDSNSDCVGDLLCGSNNCDPENPVLSPTDDCCFRPPPPTTTTTTPATPISAPITTTLRQTTPTATSATITTITTGPTLFSTRTTTTTKTTTTTTTATTTTTTTNTISTTTPTAPGDVVCNGGDSCCSVSSPCKEGEGDCDSNLHCEGDLLCGANNCDLNNPGFDTTDDCCFRPTAPDLTTEPTETPISTISTTTTTATSSTNGLTLGCNGGDSCCSESNRCKEGEGDCDSDTECEVGLRCGSNNCDQEKPSFDPSDDCCFRPAITTSGRRPGEPLSTTTNNSSSTCGELRRMRKNLTSLTEAESQRLEAALKEMIDSGRFSDLGNFHGEPLTICSTSTGEGTVCCPHGVSIFLPWHRLYMVQMEEELGMALPYWDWSQTVDLPRLWSTVAAPIKEGTTSACDPPQIASISVDAQWDAELLRSEIQTALHTTRYSDFWRALNTPHNRIHLMFGCDMSLVATSAYVPLFFLHHSFVDFVWAFWQELQRLRGLSVEADWGIFTRRDFFDLPLEPFYMQRYNGRERTLRNSKGIDTFNYKDNFCYEYDQLIFDGMTPVEFLDSRPQARTLSDDVPTGRDMFTQGRGTVRSPEIGKCGEWCWKVNLQNRHISCTDICVGKENQHPALKVFVGGVLPKMVGSGSTLFQLHQDEKWIDAGSFFTFGRRFSRSVNLLRRRSWVRHAVDSTTHYIAELEVTNVLIEEGWSAEEPLVARLVSGVLRNVPQPLVIVKELHNDIWIPTTVNLHPAERADSYGDLLGTFEDAQINLNSG